VPLGELCDINPRRDLAPEPEANELVTFVPMPALDERTGTITQAETKPYETVRKGYTFFREGDVLFAKITPCMQNGKHAVAQQLRQGIGFGSTEFHVLRPGAELLADWLHLFLRQPSVLAEAAAHFEGSVGQQRVPAAFLRQLVMPVPPLEEQERLVKLLQEQLAAAEVSHLAAEEQLPTLRVLSAAILSEAFEDAAQNQIATHAMTLKWPRRKLSEVCASAKQVVLPGSTDAKNRPYVGMEHVESDTGCIGAAVAVADKEVDTVQSLTYAFDESHVLYGKLRPYLNKVALPDFAGRCSTELVPLLPNAQLDREYLAFYLRRTAVAVEVMRESTGSRMPRADMSKLFQLEIPVPPLNIQRQITASLKQQIAATTAARAAAEAQIASLRQLPAALLRQAFAPVAA
jgi:type I restriction enzyme, S subunit